MTDITNEIREMLGADAARVHLQVYEAVGSTNDLLRMAADDGAPEFTVIAAKQQTAGKGRQGRAFYSPPETGLYLSMLLRPQLSQEALLAVTPMAAVAAAEAVEESAGVQTEIKWVNDLLISGKKICGILAESQFSEGRTVPDYVIVGIGINLLEPEEGFPEEIREIAGAVFPRETDAHAAFTRCAAALISALLRQYAGLRARRYLAGYKQRLCVLGRTVTVIENGIETAAEAVAVDDALRLLVRYADGTEQWRETGEIRIKL